MVARCNYNTVMRTKFDKRPERDIIYLYRDDDIIAISKPAWLLSVPGRGEHKIDSVAHRVQQQYPNALIVHRLDWATSGVLIMALNPDAHRRLNQQFEHRQSKKRYIAIVCGIVACDEQKIDLPLRCDWENRPRQIVDFERGKQAETRLVVDHRDRKKQQTRLQLMPVTGRSHQLRVHCQAIGHAIVGDQLYAPPGCCDSAARLLLHAEWLKVKHPRTQIPIEFCDPSPF